MPPRAWTFALRPESSDISSMKTVLAIGFVLLLGTPAIAGCIGPIIMGHCKGREVPWDTHSLAGQRPHRDPPAGFYWDWRSDRGEMNRIPNAINPFTGHDANDSTYGSQRQAPASAPEDRIGE